MVTVTPNSERGLLEELRDALGGAARIARVGSYAREAVLRFWEPDRGGAGKVDPGSLTSSLRALLGAHPGRETTFRAAPGRVRYEVRARGPGSEGADVAPALIALAGPDASHDPRDSAHGGTGAQARADCAACAGAAVLREAAFEPRNLLAHAQERGVALTTVDGANGPIELTVERDGLRYRFDRATRLCSERIDGPRGRTTLYRDWTRVGGVATPFLEVEQDGLGRLERRVLAVAYDLPWPARLFCADS